MTPSIRNIKEILEMLPFEFEVHVHDIEIKQSFIQKKHVWLENLCGKEYYLFTSIKFKNWSDLSAFRQKGGVTLLPIGVIVVTVKTKEKECGSGLSSR